jgi:ribosome-associated protein
MGKNDLNSEQLANEIVAAIQEIKGENIIKLDLRKLDNSVSDFFIVCHGGSNTHVNSIAGSVEKDISKAFKEKPWKVEGRQNSEWVLMDYGNVVVHVFQQAVREFYNIEDLWADGEVTVYED